MPSSPRTPLHSRQPSALDFSPSTMSQSRRLSKSSLHTPTTANHMNRDFSSGVDGVSMGMSMDVLASAQNGANGLGNLADELADAWSEEEEGEEMEEGNLNFQNTAPSDSDIEDYQDNNGPVRKSGDISTPNKQSAFAVQTPNPLNLTPPVGGRGRVHALGHARTPSEYDGSDYGGESDLDSPQFTPALLARMDMVEGLARRGTENNGSQADGVVKRVIESLRDLGGQAGVEGNTTRFVFHFFVILWPSMVEDSQWSLLVCLLTKPKTSNNSHSLINAPPPSNPAPPKSLPPTLLTPLCTPNTRIY